MHEKQTTVPAPQHYFAATMYEWACAPSFEEAVKACAARHPQDLILHHVENSKGLKMRVCCVHTAQEMGYEIDDEYGWPTGVEISEKQIVRVVDRDGTLKGA